MSPEAGIMLKTLELASKVTVSATVAYGAGSFSFSHAKVPLWQTLSRRSPGCFWFCFCFVFLFGLIWLWCWIFFVGFFWGGCFGGFCFVLFSLFSQCPRPPAPASPKEGRRSRAPSVQPRPRVRKARVQTGGVPAAGGMGRRHRGCTPWVQRGLPPPGSRLLPLKSPRRLFRVCPRVGERCRRGRGG